MLTITTPLTKETIRTLKAGDRVLISGTIYTARDAAHKRMTEELNAGCQLPFDVKEQIIFYAGPCPERPGCVIGSIGPTTSQRMDKYSPILFEKGLSGAIGKGKIGDEVIEAIIENNCVYFGTIGGAGALLAKCVRKQEVIAYADLGTEAVRRLEVEDFPAVVLVDCEGGSLLK